MLEAMTDLKADTFSRALARAILRTRVIPDIIRSDRRQEMTNHAIEELMALCSIKHRVGAAFTPRHQGPCERAHQAIMNSHYLIMHSLLDNYAQEWALAIPFLEYAAMTAPREPYGLSAWDLSCPYALLTDPKKRGMFAATANMADTDIARRNIKFVTENSGTVC